MKILCVFLIIYAFSGSLIASNNLVFGQIEKMKSEGDFYVPLTQIMQIILQGSEFNLQEKSIPIGERVIADIVRGSTDITLMALHEQFMHDFPYEFIDVYPVPLIELHRHYYGLGDSAITSSDVTNVEAYRLGMMRMPREFIPTLLAQDVGALTMFSSHLKLSKGLLAKHVDIVVLGKRVAHAAFNELGSRNKVKDLGYAYSVGLFVLVRKNMSPEKKASFYRLLGRRIPELKKQRAIVNILDRNNWLDS